MNSSPNTPRRFAVLPLARRSKPDSAAVRRYIIVPASPSPGRRD